METSAMREQRAKRHTSELTSFPPPIQNKFFTIHSLSVSLTLATLM